MVKFVRRARPIYWWPVNVQVQSEKKPGEFEKKTLKMQFEPLRGEERDALDQEMKQKYPDGSYKADIELLKRVTKDWAEVEDEHGNPIQFSAEELEEACEQQNFRFAAVLAYTDSLNAPLARRGN